MSNSSVDIIAFNRLFDENYHRFVRFAYGYVKDWTISEDFVSDAFAGYWENRLKLATESNPPAYILTAVRNKCLNHLIHEQNRLRIEKTLSEHNKWLLGTRIATLEACDPEEIFSTEIQTLIVQAIEKMPEKTRQIFVLSRFKDLSHKEIAEIMGLSVKSIEFHIKKATDLLRIDLKDYLISFLFLLPHLSN